MKKIILISSVVSSIVFASSLGDVAQKAVEDQAKKEVTKTVESEVAKAVPTDTKKEESNETKETSMKDKAIDAAAGAAADKVGVSKDMAKSAIKAAM